MSGREFAHEPGLFYIWNQVIPMWRMVPQATSFRPATGGYVRLTATHMGQLPGLYALGAGDAFSRAQMGNGVFCDAFADGQLVAAAGTHIVSPTYGVAAIGNIFTHSDYRGRGYGMATTSAVVAELLKRGIRDIALNASQKNQSAVCIYERLGFKRYCPFLEGCAVWRPFILAES